MEGNRAKFRRRARARLYRRKLRRFGSALATWARRLPNSRAIRACLGLPRHIKVSAACILLWSLGFAPSLGALKNVDDILFKFITPPLDEAHMRPVLFIDMAQGTGKCAVDPVARRSSAACMARIIAAAGRYRASAIVIDIALSPPHAYPSTGDAALRTAISEQQIPIVAVRDPARPPDGERRPLLVPTYLDDLAPDHIQFASFVLTGDAGKVGRYWGAVRGSDGTLLPSVPTLLTGRHHVFSGEPDQPLRAAGVPFVADARFTGLKSLGQNLFVAATPEEILEAQPVANASRRVWIIGNSRSESDKHPTEDSGEDRPGSELLAYAVAQRSLIYSMAQFPTWLWTAMVALIALGCASLLHAIKGRIGNELLAVAATITLSALLMRPLPWLFSTYTPMAAWQASGIAQEAGLVTLLCILAYYLVEGVEWLYHSIRDASASG